ncbi:MAG: Na+/H+ antiporter NhaA [Calditrichaeota bacterium]|nr:MAG: Na+/H+ antiporter NhaA [Calditrichota bacterium]
MSKDIKEPKLRPIEKLTKPLTHFLHIEATSGLVLLVATIAAIVVANSPYEKFYSDFWNTLLNISIGEAGLSYPLWYWVNDGLMTIFFFLVGLEIKREIVSGELREVRRVISPAVAAIGGAVVPAAIFIFLLGDNPGMEGWAVPMATDIAFVVGVLAILGKRVPQGLKVFLLALAIVDDIIAVLVIAVFYSGALSFLSLFLAALGVVLIVVMNKLGVRSLTAYILTGSFVWLATLKSGIHPTIAGVVLGFLTPALPFISKEKLKVGLKETIDYLNKTDSSQETPKIKESIDALSFTATESISPLERLEKGIHPWAAFLIMPIFALANAGVPFSLDAVSSSLSVSIITALFIGKPLGIVLSLLILVKFGLGIKPGGANWLALIGGGCLAGIGFTMSLFVASLSMEGALLVNAKMGVLVGSALSGVTGFLLLFFSLSKNR